MIWFPNWVLSFSSLIRFPDSVPQFGSLIWFPQLFHRHNPTAMYKPSPKSSLLNDVIVASAGAGLITTLAMAHGQHPAIAFSITFGSALAAVVLNRSL